MDNIPGELFTHGGEEMLTVMTTLCQQIWHILNILNSRIRVEKHIEHDLKLYHNFIDYKKTFDRVWHEGLWNVMRQLKKD